MVLDNLLSSIQPQSFLEWTRTSSEQSIGIVYHSSWWTSSSRFGDVECGNLFLTLVSETHQTGSMMSNLVIVMAGEYVQVHLHVLHTITEQFRLCEWGHCRLGKLHRCSERTSGSWDESVYPNLPTYSLAVIRPLRVVTGPTEHHGYCCPNHHRTSRVFHSWNRTRHSGLYVSLIVTQT
jgi:hypothetical protein